MPQAHEYAKAQARVNVSVLDGYRFLIVGMLAVMSRGLVRRGIEMLVVIGMSLPVAVASALLPSTARAQSTAPSPPEQAHPPEPSPSTPPLPATTPVGPAAVEPRPPSGADNLQLVQDLETAPPPPSSLVYFQYGVAFTAEQILSAGPICKADNIPCVLGDGGGIVVRGGWRSSGPLYVGAAYELTKQDPNKLYRIALLQQFRGEARYYFMTARVTEPYLSASAGFAGYGNQFSIDTWGPGGSFGVGVEYQISHRTVVGLGMAYRLLYFSRFTDTAGSPRDPGIAQLLGFDLVLEQRDAFVTSGQKARSP